MISYIYNIYIHIWIFQVCKICELFAKKQPTKKRQKCYISGGSIYAKGDEQKNESKNTPTYPWSIPQESLNPQMKGIPNHKPLEMGVWGMFQGYVGKFLIMSGSLGPIIFPNCLSRWGLLPTTEHQILSHVLYLEMAWPSPIQLYVSHRKIASLYPLEV